MAQADEKLPGCACDRRLQGLPHRSRPQRRKRSNASHRSSSPTPSTRASRSAMRPSPESTRLIEVHFKPGVMDPVAQSTRDAIAEMLPHLEPQRHLRRHRRALRHHHPATASDDDLTRLRQHRAWQPRHPGRHPRPPPPRELPSRPRLRVQPRPRRHPRPRRRCPDQAIARRAPVPLARRDARCAAVLPRRRPRADRCRTRNPRADLVRALRPQDAQGHGQVHPPSRT